MLATAPSVVMSERRFFFTRSSITLLVEKNHAYLCAARPNDLLAALKVRLLSTTALLGRLANGVYFTPLVT